MPANKGGNTLKIPTSFWAAVALLALAQAAQAAPKVSGKYVLMVFTQCEAKFTTTMGNYVTPGTTTAPAVRTVNPAQSGELNIGVGSITFPAVAAASTGNASFEAILVSGGALRINNSGNAMAAHAETAAGPFSFTNTAFVFRPVGEPAMTWAMRAGDIMTSGVARTLYLVRREDARVRQRHHGDKAVAVRNCRSVRALSQPARAESLLNEVHKPAPRL